MGWFKKRDPDATLIGDRRDLTAGSSADDLAREFITQLPRSGFEPTVVDSEEKIRARQRSHSFGSSRSPQLAALCSLLVPGGGLFFVDAKVLGSIVFILSSILLGLSLFPAQAAPNLASPYFPLFAMGASALLWWLGLVISSTIAHRKQISTHLPYRSLFWMLSTSPLPVLNHYVQRRFFRGHLAGLCFFIMAAGGVLALLLWRNANPNVQLFRASFLLFLLGGVGSLISMIVGVLGAIYEAQGLWIDPSRVRSERKFITLGGLIVLVGITYIIFGEPGQKVRTKLYQIESRLASSSKKSLIGSLPIKRGLREWEKAGEAIKDAVNLVR